MSVHKDQNSYDEQRRVTQINKTYLCRNNVVVAELINAREQDSQARWWQVVYVPDGCDGDCEPWHCEIPSGYLSFCLAYTIAQADVGSEC